MGVFIEHLDCYLPQQPLDFEAHLDHFDNGLSPHFKNSGEFMAFAKSVLSLKNVAIEKELSLADMTMNLLRDYFEKENPDPSSFDYIIIATDYGDQLRDFGHQVQHRFGLHKAASFRISDNYCANIDLALGLAADLLRTKKTPARALLIAGCKLDDNLPDRLVGTYGIMGDSASIAVLSNDNGRAILEMTDQAVITKGALAEMDLTKDNTLVHFQAYTQCLQQLLKTSALDPRTVSHVIIHNANQLLIGQAIKSCGINPGTIDRTNQGKFGHLGTSDLVLNLQTNLSNNKQDRQNILSLNLGIIGTYVATLFKR